MLKKLAFVTDWKTNDGKFRENHRMQFGVTEYLYYIFTVFRIFITKTLVLYIALHFKNTKPSVFSDFYNCFIATKNNEEFMN